MKGIPPVFGLAKRWHGFGRCRYLGLRRYRLPSAVTFMVGNVDVVLNAGSPDC